MPREVPEHFSFWHPQQLRFYSPKLEHDQPKSHTNNLHFKKNLVQIGLPYQKLLNFGRKKSKFPTVPRFDTEYAQWEKGWSKFKKVIHPNLDFLFFTRLLPASFPVPAFEVNTLEKILVFFICGRVNFDLKYLEFCLDFDQHIYTHSKGFLVSFLTSYIKILSDF
jgi:hypothetical protein